jgi:hypothetical protein
VAQIAHAFPEFDRRFHSSRDRGEDLLRRRGQRRAASCFIDSALK